jgi:hypothetical protein
VQSQEEISAAPPLSTRRCVTSPARSTVGNLSFRRTVCPKYIYRMADQATGVLNSCISCHKFVTLCQRTAIHRGHEKLRPRDILDNTQCNRPIDCATKRASKQNIGNKHRIKPNKSIVPLATNPTRQRPNPVNVHSVARGHSWATTWLPPITVIHGTHYTPEHFGGGWDAGNEYIANMHSECCRGERSRVCHTQGTCSGDELPRACRSVF